MPGLNIEIHKVSLSKIELLQKISRSTFFESYAPFNSKEDMDIYLNVNFGLENLTKELNNEDSEFYFATLDEETIGYFKINFDKAQTVEGYPNTLEIERIYISKEHQGKKIGERMLAKIKEIAKQHKNDFVWLGVWKQNFGAIKFYERNGFTIYGEHPFLFGTDLQTDHLMKLEI
jgi:ribosomal protein S18 acetylase RimI-like enzyme